jgi:hypothetical protein
MDGVARERHQRERARDARDINPSFSVAGKVEKGTIHLTIHFLFVAEYFTVQKALCTQSWNATGPRK